MGLVSQPGKKWGDYMFLREQALLFLAKYPGILDPVGTRRRLDEHFVDGKELANDAAAGLIFAPADAFHFRVFCTVNEQAAYALTSYVESRRRQGSRMPVETM